MITKEDLQGTIIDVRTPGEFNEEHFNNAINIPLSEIPLRMDEIKNFKMPLILCCASGGRSEQAQHYISASGLECIDGGSWKNVKNFHLNNL